MSTSPRYDVVVVGAGICGAALAYVLSRYTNVESLLLIEKNDRVARQNSDRRSNSQTLHAGDVETNYDLERSREVQRGAWMVRRYLEENDASGDIHTRQSKMVLGVGLGEANRLRRRFSTYREDYPELRLVDDREAIADVEPEVVRGRPEGEEILALLAQDGLAVDFGRLAESFLDHATSRRPDFATRFEERVTEVLRVDDGYEVRTSRGVVGARVLAVTAGAHSLFLARQLGLGADISLMSVSGGFFLSRSLLRGKVYTLQKEGLPFAAVHGDAEVHEPELTRFGPTAMPVPALERGRVTSTFVEYLRSARLDARALRVLARVMLRPSVLGFALQNLVYGLPVLGRRAFARTARKIVPTLDASQLRRARGWGGIRPQVVDCRAGDLDFGEKKLFDDRAIFCVTPSPGASMCLQSAEADARLLVGWLGPGAHFDEVRFEAELGRRRTPGPPR